MKLKNLPLICFLITGIIFFVIHNGQASSISSNNLYEAIVLGQMLKKNVKKSGNYYITEYKLKPKEWLYKKPGVKKSNVITVKVLGADLPKRGLIIKASTSPDYIPMMKDAIFFLVKTKSEKDDVFTITKNGVIYTLADIKS